MNRTHVVSLTTASVLALATGAAGGYFLAMKRLTKQFDQELTVQIAEAKKYYGELSQKQYPTPAEAVKDLIENDTPPVVQEALKTYGGHVPRKTVPLLDEALEEEEAGIVIREVIGDTGNAKTEEFTKNIFAEPPVHVDLGQAVREPGRPYLITGDEFMADERNFTQITFTYYVGDHVLTNERDDVMDQINQIVGHANLEKAKDLPEGENVLYVRNEKYESEYEIVISQGKYSVEVAGFEE